MSATDHRLRRLAVILTGREMSALPMTLCRRHAHGADDGEPECRAVFIEDSDLLKAADLPFTYELCALTLQRRPLAAGDLEAHFAREARAAEQDFALLAAHAGFRARFDIVRDAKRRAMLAALAEADALLIAPGRSAATPPPARLCVLVDSSPSGTRAEAFAAEVATREGLLLEVLAVPPAADVAAGADALARLLTRRDAALTVIAGNLLANNHDAGLDVQSLLSAPLLIVA